MLLCLDKRYFHSELLSFCQQLEVSVSQSLVYRTISIFDMNFLFINILHVLKPSISLLVLKPSKYMKWKQFKVSSWSITRVKPRGSRHQSICMHNLCCWAWLPESLNSNRRLWHWYLSIVLSTENWRWFTSGNWHWAKFEDYRHIFPWFASWCHWCTSWFAFNFRM